MSKFQRMAALGLISLDKPDGDNKEGSGSETPQKSPWDELFAGKTPEEVKKALDESRKWEDRAKANAAAAAERDALKAAADQGKTEQEKLLERLAALEAENNATKQRDQIAAWAKEIVKDSKVPADALRGTTEDELKAHFAQLNALIGTTTTDSTADTTAKRGGAWAPYAPDEGKSNKSGDAQQSASRPGIGTLRDAYAEAEASK